MSTASANDVARSVAFLLGKHGDEELLDQLLDRICTAAPPTRRAKYVGRNDTYGITRIPTTVDGREVVERAGLGASTKIVYPGSSRKDA